MVVQESLAHGIPVVVRKGTGAVGALGAHGAGEAIDLTAGIGLLENILRRWLGDAALRKRWQSAAEAASGELPRWEDTAREVLRAVVGPKRFPTGAGCPPSAWRPGRFRCSLPGVPAAWPRTRQTPVHRARLPCRP